MVKRVSADVCPCAVVKRTMAVKKVKIVFIISVFGIDAGILEVAQKWRTANRACCRWDIL